MRSFLALTALIAPTLWRLTEAALYTDPSLLPQLRYDFIIVGGKPFHPQARRRLLIPVLCTAGTAGNVLANRLSENAAYTVLVVEAGGSYVSFLLRLSPTANSAIPVGRDEEVFAIQVPFLDSTLSSDASIIWNYTTTAQTGLFNRSISYPRGRVLGGSSSISGLNFLLLLVKMVSLTFACRLHGMDSRIQRRLGPLRRIHGGRRMVMGCYATLHDKGTVLFAMSLFYPNRAHVFDSRRGLSPQAAGATRLVKSTSLYMVIRAL